MSVMYLNCTVSSWSHDVRILNFPALEVNLEMESDLVQVALSVLFRLISFHF